MVLSRYARGTLVVLSRYARGMLVVLSRYHRGMLVVLPGFARQSGGGGIIKTVRRAVHAAELGVWQNGARSATRSTLGDGSTQTAGED